MPRFWIFLNAPDDADSMFFLSSLSGSELVWVVQGFLNELDFYFHYERVSIDPLSK